MLGPPRHGRPKYACRGCEGAIVQAPAGDALKLQRPLADGALRIVARGEKEDKGGLTV
jgi:transposase